MRRYLCLLALLLMTCLLVGCRGLVWLGMNLTGGIKVHTYENWVSRSGSVGRVGHQPFTPVAGQRQYDLPGAIGWISQFGLYAPALTDANGSLLVWDGRAPAVWAGQAFCETMTGGYWTYPPQVHSIWYPWGSFDLDCYYGYIDLPSASTRFAVAGTEPGTLTLQGKLLSSAYGMPILYVADASNSNITQVNASSVSPDGSFATFPFPRQANGSPLLVGFYGMDIANWDTPTETYCEPMFDEWGTYIGDNCWDQPGQQRRAASHFVSVGSSTAVAGRPFGIDAIDTSIRGQECWIDPYYGAAAASTPEPSRPPGGESCTDWSYMARAPLITLNGTGQLKRGSQTLSVGSSPTSVKVYRRLTTVDSYGDGWYWFEESTTTPTRAVVVNSMSNTVSIVDLVNWQVTSTVAVGPKPTDVALNGSETRAYVSNYDGSSISEIDLNLNSVTRQLQVSAHPTSLSVDSSANVLWAGGEGWLAKIDLGSFTIVDSYSFANGTVTSVGFSRTQNTVVYTIAQNSNLNYGAAVSGSEPAPMVQKTQLVSPTGTLPGTAISYAVSSVPQNDPIPSPLLLAGGTKVSAYYANGLAVSATPGGFVVYDVVGGDVFMIGTTPSAVRAIATDPTEGIAYLTMPDSNAIITVSLPPTP